MSSSTERRSWRSVSKRRPCSHCGGINWCRMSIDDGVTICRRLLEGGELRVDKRGDRYCVVLTGPVVTGRRQPTIGQTSLSTTS